MTRHDWLIIGLKLLGVYFAVLGLSGLWGTIVVLIAASSHHGGTTGGATVSGVALLQPLVYILAAFVLTRQTQQCLRWCGETEMTSHRTDSSTH